MPLDKQSTTLLQAPYYDDYDETKNFHRVLFKPSVAVQARELTQLQTILQNQIERFGDNIYQTGTIIKGCSLTTDDQYYYVKLFDVQPSGSPYTISAIANTYVADTLTGLRALVVNYAVGGQQLGENQNTLYLKYLNTGSGGQKQYANNAVLTVYNRNYRVESIQVVSGGSGYSNSDIIQFIGTSTITATATVGTWANGTIRIITLTNQGSGYLNAPAANVTNSTGGATTGVGASLIVYNSLAQVQVANSSYTAPVGRGTAIKTSDGVIYQKGHFVRVAAQEAILSKYTTSPSNVSVGFVTSEAVVNSNSDQTLTDNAGGTSNYTAPGADRLKLTATLTVLGATAAAANNQFLSLYEYEDGRVIKDRTQTQFNSVGKELARRTYEESGNYVVNDFPMYTETISSNNTHLNLNVGAGVGYVQGNRVQIINNTKYPVRKGTDYQTESTQTISTNYGGYVYVKELMGRFDITYGASVTLYNDMTGPYGRQAISAGTGIGAPSGGVQIGTARARSLVYDSGIPGAAACTYRLYLFDVTMAPGYTFRDVRTVLYNPLGSATAVADVIQDTALGYATQYDQQFDSLLFNTGTFAVKQLNSPSAVNRGSLANSSIKFNSAGLLAVTLPGGTVFPYTASSTLNAIQKRDFVIIPHTDAESTTSSTGNITVSSGANTVAGTSTAFSIQYSVGDYIKVGNAGVAGDVRLITAINSNTSMTVATNFSSSYSANTHRQGYPANVPINLAPSTKTVGLSGGDQVSINIGAIFIETLVTMYYDYKQTAPPLIVKTANTYYTKLSTTAIAASPNGPWCLGIPDAVKLTGVYINISNGYATTGTNRVADFILDNGQSDNFYGLGYIKKKPGSSLTLGPNDCLVATYKALTRSAGSYMSTQSYGANVVDDTTTTLPANRIRTQDIPVYVSPKTGKSYDLRDVVDFRPMVANTAAYAASLGAATVDPATTTSDKFDLSVDKIFPSPTREFEAAIESYLARRDRVVIDAYGEIRIIEGQPSNTPSVPTEPEGSMTVGIVTVPPFPTLSAKDASDAGRPDLGTYTTPQQNRRYTMKDISDIEGRINRLEYYTLLNTLETNTKQLVLPSEANTSIERFKNGFFVDPLSDYNVSNIQDSEYKILIDSNKGIARPYFNDTKINLNFQSASPPSSNVTRTGDLVTFSYGEKVLLEQPIATRDRSLVDQYWRYTGVVKCVPAFDNFYDVEKSAVSIAIDIASPLNSLAQATSAALSELKVSSSLLSTVNVGGATLVSRSGNANGRITETYSQNVTKTFQDTKVGITGGNVTESSSYIGEFVNDVSLKEYIREQRICFITTGLRPGATHYVFFDQDLMTARVTPCTVDLTIAQPTQANFISTGVIGAALVANSTGCAAGMIDLPGSTYFIGDHSVIVMDATNVASEDTATSKSVGKFIGFTHQLTKTDLSVATKSVEVSGTNGSYGSKTYLGNPYAIADRYTFDREVDPLSQTFRIQPQLDNTDGVYVLSVDVYFKAKDLVQGVNLEIRETTDDVNPSPIVVPFSRVHLTSGQVTTTTNASTATRFTFQSPVYLRTNGTYAIVMYPDANSPEYRVFTAVVGGTDVNNTNLVSNQNWGLGTLFYSTTGSTWTAVQDEDLKFRLNRATFTANNQGTISLTNADYEFLTIATGPIGTFRGGEDIAQLHPNNYINGIISTTTTNNVIGTPSNLTSQLAQGDDVLIIYGVGQAISTANVAVSGVSVIGYSSEVPTFNTEYTVGDFIKFGNSSVGEIRQVIARTATTMTIDCILNGTPTNLRHYRLSPEFQVAKVLSINASTITLNKPPRFATSATLQATVQKVVTGKVDSYNYANNRVYVAESTSSASNFKMYAANSTYSGLIVGDTTQARAFVASIDNIPVNYFRPVFSTIATPGTGISMQTTFTKSDGVAIDTSSYQLGLANKIPFNDYSIIKSKSNELVGSTLTKSLNINLTLTSSSSDTSPVLDVNPVSIIITRNIVDNYNDGVFFANNLYANTTVVVPSTTLTQFAVGMGVQGRGIPSGTAIASITAPSTLTLTKAATATATNIELKYNSNETTRYGISKSKYISKRLELAEGMDAEDVKVFLTAYKPTGTSVDVYAKILNGTDGNTFDTKEWTLLTQTTNATQYSDSLNEEDYREFEYTFPQTPPATAIIGVATSANTTDTLASVVIANTTGGFSCTSTANLVVGSAVTVSGSNGTAITSYANPTTYRVGAVANATHFVMTTTAGAALTTTAGTPTGLTFTAPSAVIGVDTTFTTHLAVGDLIKVVKSNTLTDYDIVKVATVVSDTILYTTTPITFRSNGCTIEKVDQPKAAFKYSRNPAGNIVRYHNESGAPYDSYKYLALKVVLRSPYSYLVPTLNDVRALAVSI